MRLFAFARTKRLIGKLDDLPNESLFQVDRSGDKQVRESVKFRRLRIDQILEPQSAVPAIHQKKKSSAVKVGVAPYSGRPRFASKTTLQQIEKLAEKKKALLAKKPAAAAVTKKKPRTEETEDALARGKKRALVDPWADEAVAAGGEGDYLDPVRPKTVKRPKLPDERPAVPNVKPALGGASYNPSFEDHQKILQKVVEQHAKTKKEAKKIKRKLAYPKELDELEDEDYFFSDNEEEEDEPAEPSDDLPLKKPVTNQKKTKTQRNKEAAIAQKERELAAAREKKNLLKQINKIGEITKEVERKEREDEAARAELAKRKLSPKDIPAEKRSLGPERFKPLPLEVKPEYELGGSLRSLEPEGNLFRDRFVSLQERTLIETRKRAKFVRKYKRTPTERYDYRRFDREHPWDK
ncbi:ribosome biogenesis protein Nop53/GLTSCR2 [Zopfochytrium polystomum]|nr:ribosome biogenesis protein Nop53/GLTSCR2 [Zopfochytrium polystomum]